MMKDFVTLIRWLSEVFILVLVFKHAHWSVGIVLTGITVNNELTSYDMSLKAIQISNLIKMKKDKYENEI